jgi:4-hydroxy-tetrahydrodipicolinate reductase
MTTRVHVHGVTGRMGRSIVRALADAEGLLLVGAVSRQALAVDAGTLAGVRPLGVNVTDQISAMRGDVVIDFSRSEATEALAKQATEMGFALVVGTTGLEPSALAALEAASRVVPVIVAANTSVGVTVLAHLAQLATKLLGEGFDAEIVEMHHNQKADAPSGTALRIADAVLAAKGLDRSAIRTGRDGKPGPRTKHEVGVLAMRGGDVIGDHTLVLAGEGERIELTHKATDRALFAKGALRAARWIAGRDAGRYDMRDVIGL